MRGADLDERLARALEDDLITEKKPKWNKRERDPQSYRKKYRSAPAMEEVRRASNTFFSFFIDLLP